MQNSGKKIHHYRKSYTKDAISIHNTAENPYNQFKHWFEMAEEIVDLEPNAMVLSTVNSQVRPSSRIVLLKEFSVEKGFVFFSNYDSRKGNDLKLNPFASLLFFWGPLEKQVRIEGVVEKISEKESDEYFYSRPIESQIGALASPQSKIIEQEDFLINNFNKILNSKNIKRPENWGGYTLKANYFEFWQGKIGRLHDRITYTHQNNAWLKNRIAP
jgi:pyridoxamine 5'-phosphate oxidase